MMCMKAFILAKVPQPDNNENIIVNFRPELKEIIRETRYLDRMSFKLPEVALNIALQEEKYHKFIDQLNLMLSSHEELLSSLDSSEKKLLTPQLSELKRVMKPGFTRLNWNSLGIHDYIGRANLVLSFVKSNFHRYRRKSTSYHPY